jgi:1,4-alpha-glucan branching enzyme
MALFASSYYLDMPQLWTLQPGNLNYNAAVDWDRAESNLNSAQLVRLQSDMKKFYTTDESFAPYNVHRHMVHWIDHDNKAVAFERIDFATGKRTYAVVNLGDRAIADYRIPVFPEDATFLTALDSDRSIYGGQDRNPTFVKADNHELEFFLPPYGVLGFVQQDQLVPPQPEESPIELPEYDRSEGYYYGFYDFYGNR